MNERDENYRVGDALEDAFSEFLTTLLGGGHVSISVHEISRHNFDQIPGDERHHPARKDAREFWAKKGFDWRNERHYVYVNYFTNERPVVVPLRAEKATV